MVRVGAQLYTIREFCQTPEGFLESLKKVKEMGYKTVQVSGAGKDIPAEFIADALKETGLSCDATHITFDEMMDDLDKVIHKHNLWECKHIGIGGMPGHYRSEEGYAAFVKDAGLIAEKLKDAGKVFIYHNHSHEYELFGGKRGMDILFDNTPECFQFELDLYWVQNAGADPIQWIRKVAGRMDIVHFKEMDMIAGEKEHIMAPIGAGNMNWDGIIQALNETGVKIGYVEQDVCRNDPFECLRDSLVYLNSKGVPA